MLVGRGELCPFFREAGFCISFFLLMSFASLALVVCRMIKKNLCFFPDYDLGTLLLESHQLTGLCLPSPNVSLKAFPHLIVVAAFDSYRVINSTGRSKPWRPKTYLIILPYHVSTENARLLIGIDVIKALSCCVQIQGMLRRSCCPAELTFSSNLFFSSRQLLMQEL